MTDYKRIAKNSIYLYCRMVFSLLISLYTSRVILKVLGFEDFGLYNVVGGILLMIAFFQSSLTNVNVRFFCFEQGKDDLERLRKIFRFSITCYCMIAILVLIIAETIGLWFVNTKLIIPSDRLFAANIIYQCSIVSFLFSLLSIPSNAAVIAHEKMHVFSYIGIFQSTSNLLIAICLQFSTYDKLVLYGSLQTIISFISLFFYTYYAKAYFSEFSLHRYWDKGLFNEMFPYVSWNMVGCAVWSLNSQGVNILINIFFGAIVNAARGIAFQVSNLISIFSLNLYSAFRPQITKLYASGNYEEFQTLIFRSTRYSFFMAWLIALPILYHLSFIMNLWLGKYPPDTIIFTELTIVFVLIDFLNEPIWTAVQASGHLKRYQIWGNFIYVISFPIIFVLFMIGCEAYYSMIVLIVVRFLRFFIILNMVSFVININFMLYMKLVIIPILCVVSISFIGFVPFRIILGYSSLFINVCGMIICCLINGLVVYYYGFDVEEKRLVRSKLSEMYRKFF